MTLLGHYTIHLDLQMSQRVLKFSVKVPPNLLLSRIKPERDLFLILLVLTRSLEQVLFHIFLF